MFEAVPRTLWHGPRRKCLICRQTPQRQIADDVAQQRRGCFMKQPQLEVPDLMWEIVPRRRVKHFVIGLSLLCRHARLINQPLIKGVDQATRPVSVLLNSTSSVL